MLEIAFFAVAIVLTLLGGWLAACDAALHVVSRNDLSDLANESRRPKQLQSIAGSIGQHIMAVVFLRIVSETTAAVLITLAFTRLLDQWWLALLLSAAIMVLVSFILVGSSPRAVGRSHARGLIKVSAPLIRATRLLIGPLASLLLALGDRVTPGRQRETAFTNEDQLLSMIDEATAHAVLEEDDRELIHSIFEFNETVVREVMVPRTDMESVDADMIAEDALKVFLNNGFSRMPVFGESLDDIRGILYLRDVVKSRTWRPDENERAEDIARAALFVPESKKADDTLAQLQAEKVHVAMVVDEYGGIAGLVTLEDLIEELVGEIVDEHDRDSDIGEPQADGSMLVSARLPIDELGDLFDIPLDDDDVDTVGGLVAKHLGRLPSVGDLVDLGKLHLEVVRTDGQGKNRRNIGLVKARLSSVTEHPLTETMES
ncbi:hemolysin family protein [Humidisolicoccus flavus]|uniref:hemolysin family protein n=1 Tax=Humidisolicoccus flavus TaxID=3111414 RepID=UPI003247A2A4